MKKGILSSLLVFMSFQLFEDLKFLCIPAKISPILRAEYPKGFLPTNLHK